MMRTGIFSIGAVLALTISAQAAEQRWTGFYAGASLGAGSARATADFSVLGVPAISGSEKLDGFVGGGQAGYNRQFGWLVVGAELDVQFATQKASSSQACAALACGLVSITQSSSDKLTWFGTLRPRVGVAAGAFLIYGTGGIAYGRFEDTNTLTTLLGSVTTTTIDQHAAWVYGGGIEGAINQNWSVKFEYLFMDSGTVTTNYSLLGVGLITEKSRMTESLIRAGINYRF
jgi:outer membrane immunogenic protein